MPRQSTIREIVQSRIEDSVFASWVRSPSRMPELTFEEVELRTLGEPVRWYSGGVISSSQPYSNLSSEARNANSVEDLKQVLIKIIEAM